MNTNHTPGPWHASKSPINNHGQGLVTSEATGDNIAVCYDIKDALIIAAAPDLLSTLSALVDWLEESGLSKTPGAGVGPFKHPGTTYSVVRDAQAAIQKATEKE